MESLPPGPLDLLLDRQEELKPPVLRTLGSALLTEDSALRSRLEEYLIELSKSRARALAKKNRWSNREIDRLVALQLVDPMRFVQSPTFRSRVTAVLARSFDGALPVKLRDRNLFELNQIIGFDYELSEQVESSWKAIPRLSRDRRVDFSPSFAVVQEDSESPIEASFFSLSSQFFDFDDVEPFLRAILRQRGGRDVVVLSDLPLRNAIVRQVREPRLETIETYGRLYSPWPRDPFSIARDRRGRVILLTRPNVQPGREEDSNLAREIVQGLPTKLDERWQGVRWATAPTPFHNGHVLLTPDAAWITIHTLEVRNLQQLGLDAVPVSSFSTSEGVAAYLEVSRRSAEELGTLYGRPVRFVHPLPISGDIASKWTLLRELAGGGGFDLDSLLTLVPAKDGPAQALVADITLGLQLVMNFDREVASSLAQSLGLGMSNDELRTELTREQTSRRAAALDRYLEIIAAHLERLGMKVYRLPLVIVPTRLLANSSGISHPDFLLTWNNVVLERTNPGLRAEGFSMLLPEGDQMAQRVFRTAGCDLILLPPLIRSLVLNGGYRCASNHVRTRQSSGQRD